MSNQSFAAAAAHNPAESAAETEKPLQEKKEQVEAAPISKTTTPEKPPSSSKPQKTQQQKPKPKLQKQDQKKPTAKPAATSSKLRKTTTSPSSTPSTSSRPVSRPSSAVPNKIKHKTPTSTSASTSKAANNNSNNISKSISLKSHKRQSPSISASRFNKIALIGFGKKQSSSPGSGGGSVRKNDMLAMRLDARRLIDDQASKIQRWFRLQLSKINYQKQIKRLQRTNAARTIQFCWLRFTYMVSLRREADFQRWVLIHKRRLLTKMKWLVRRELVRRRRAAIVLVRSVRWRLLRKIRARQMLQDRSARAIQRWYRELTSRTFREKLKTGIADQIVHNFKDEYQSRLILASEEHLDFICLVVLESEHGNLTKLGDHLEAWRLFRRHGGYDERIGRTNERLFTAETETRKMIEEEDERVERDNLRYEMIFQRRKVESREKYDKEAESIRNEKRRILSPSAASCCDASRSTTVSAMAAGFEHTGTTPFSQQLSPCERSYYYVTAAAAAAAAASASCSSNNDCSPLLAKIPQRPSSATSLQVPSVCSPSAKIRQEQMLKKHVYTSISSLL